MNSKENKENQNNNRPTQEECLASYEVLIPEATLDMAAEKGLHIRRCDEVITKRRKDGTIRARIQATPKQANGIRKNKMCSYEVYNAQGRKLCKGIFKLSLADLIELVEKYEPTEEDLKADSQYIPPFKYAKEKKKLGKNRQFLRRIGKDIKYENDRFWIVENNGDIAEGAEDGFLRVYQITNFINKNYKNKKEGKL